MKKSILNLGKALNRAEQKQINGGGHVCDPKYSQAECDDYCGSLDDIIRGVWDEVNSIETGQAAREAYNEHCGGSYGITRCGQLL